MKYKPTKIEPLRKPVREGEVETVIRIRYRTETDYEGFVDIPQAKFTEKYATKVIERELEEVKKLQQKFGGGGKFYGI